MLPSLFDQEVCKKAINVRGMEVELNLVYLMMGESLPTNLISISSGASKLATIPITKSRNNNCLAPFLHPQLFCDCF